MVGRHPGHRRVVLGGRRDECAVLDRLLHTARSGQSGVLVLRGEAGIGKSALLEYAVDGAVGFRIARTSGVESEMELPFAALHQLCAQMLDRLGRLPEPQAGGLRAAFGLSSGVQPDRFLIGLAVLSLLSEVAEEKPLLCLIEDAQWLDRASAQVLAFVVRRLHAESVDLVLAVREPSEAPEFTGLPYLVVERLPDSHARALLASVIPGRLDEQVLDRILAETQGNPLRSSYREV